MAGRGLQAAVTTAIALGILGLIVIVNLLSGPGTPPPEGPDASPGPAGALPAVVDASPGPDADCPTGATDALLSVEDEGAADALPLTPAERWESADPLGDPCHYISVYLAWYRARAVDIVADQSEDTAGPGVEIVPFDPADGGSAVAGLAAGRALADVSPASDLQMVAIEALAERDHPYPDGSDLARSAVVGDALVFDAQPGFRWALYWRGRPVVAPGSGEVGRAIVSGAQRWVYRVAVPVPYDECEAWIGRFPGSDGTIEDYRDDGSIDLGADPAAGCPVWDDGGGMIDTPTGTAVVVSSAPEDIVRSGDPGAVEPSPTPPGNPLVLVTAEVRGDRYPLERIVPIRRERSWDVVGAVMFLLGAGGVLFLSAFAFWLIMLSEDRGPRQTSRGGPPPAGGRRG